MVKVVPALAMMLVGSPAWAHQSCSVYQTPETHGCAAEGHGHAGVFERGGRGNPDTTLVLGGPAVQRELIVHHDLFWVAPELDYYFDVDMPREGRLPVDVTENVEVGTQRPIGHPYPEDFTGSQAQVGGSG